MIRRASIVASAAAVLLGGCALPLPQGPTVLVLPGTGKDFEQFQIDDVTCRTYASRQVGGVSASQVAQQRVQQGAVAGTLLGAAAGSAIGAGAAGGAGAATGAAIGGGSGLALGTLAGSEAGASSAHLLQRRFDFGYSQCMYAKGHQIPVNGRFFGEGRRKPPAAAPSSSG